jgi:AcrR family transcriptional regulator
MILPKCGKDIVLATEEFARRGYEGARVDRIAGRSRVSRNML